MAEKRYTREGYLKENYHYFHLRDTAGAELDFHFHEFDKLVLLLSGRVDYALESIVYPLRPWDILLVRHHTIHKALVDKSVPYERIIVYLDRKYFDRLMPEARLFGCFDRADERAEYLLTPDEEQRAQLSAVLGGVESCLNAADFGAQAMCDSYTSCSCWCCWAVSRPNRRPSSPARDSTTRRSPRCSPISAKTSRPR